MAVFRPKYNDPKTGKRVESAVWWYEFTFAGKRVRESAKTTRKTLAEKAEKNRRLELEKGFNGLEDRTERIQTVTEIVDAFFENYKLRNPRSATFAEFALGHVTRHLGKLLKVDVTAAAIKDYQKARLQEKAAPKSINEEVRFLLCVLQEQGDAIRAKMRREKTLKLSVRSHVAKAYSEDEKRALLAAAKQRRLPAMHLALMLGFHAGLRESEILGLQWGRVDLDRRILTVGDSKTEAGEGRTIPVNGELLAALDEQRRWFVKKFGKPRPEWFVFPYGKPQPTDPARAMTTMKTAWAKVRKDAGVSGRFHDTRHTFITDLAESGEATEQTIMDMAGHVSKQMLKHYSHIRMEAKRRAVESLTRETTSPKVVPISNGLPKESPKVSVFEAESETVRIAASD
jgi:integrase